MTFRRIAPDLFLAWHECMRQAHPAIEAATGQHVYVPGTHYYLDSDDPAETGAQAFAVRPDGELVYVWSTKPGHGARIVEAAIEDGATHLDCFDGYLVDFYRRHGFQKVTSLPNWTEGEPDVVYMALTGHYLPALDKAGQA